MSMGLVIPPANASEEMYDDTPERAMYDLAQAYEARKVTPGEARAARFQQGLDWTVSRLLVKDVPLALANVGQRRMTRKEWESSDWFRKEIPWDDDMSPLRAEVLAETFDKRRYRDFLVERGGGGGLLGFGAMIAAQALDPVNYIPIVGWAGKAARAGKLGKIGISLAADAAKLGTVTKGILAGATEAALGTAISEPFIINALQSQGEDVGWQDGAMDIMAGALIGSVFGGAGGLLQRKLLRSRISRENRTKLGTITEKALADMDAGKPVDVGNMITTRAGETLDLDKLVEVGTPPVQSTRSIEATRPLEQDALDVLQEQGAEIPAEMFEPVTWDRIEMGEGIKPEDPLVMTALDTDDFLRRATKLLEKVEARTLRPIKAESIEGLSITGHDISGLELKELLPADLPAEAFPLYEDWWGRYSKIGAELEPMQGRRSIDFVTTESVPASLDISKIDPISPVTIRDEAKAMGIDEAGTIPEMEQVRALQEAGTIPEELRLDLEVADDLAMRADSWAEGMLTVTECVVGAAT